MWLSQRGRLIRQGMRREVEPRGTFFNFFTRWNGGSRSPLFHRSRLSRLRLMAQIDEQEQISMQDHSEQGSL